MFSKGKRQKRDKRLHLSSAKIVCCSLVVTAFIFTYSFANSWANRMERIEAVASADVFKSFDLETLDGGHFTSDQLADAQITLFNVWATDCGPCVMEMPDLEELNHSYPEGQIQVVGLLGDSVDSDGTVNTAHLELANSINAQTGVTYPSLILNDEFYAFIKSDVAGTPTTFYVNSEGEIIETVVGRQEYSQMTAKVDEALAKMGESSATDGEGE